MLDNKTFEVLVRVFVNLKKSTKRLQKEINEKVQELKELGVNIEN